MDDSTARLSVRLPASAMAKLEMAAAKLSIRPAVLGRQCIDVALPYLEVGVVPNPYRAALIGEYNQIALELLIGKFLPESGQQIVDASLLRMEDFHSELPKLTNGNVGDEGTAR